MASKKSKRPAGPVNLTNFITPVFRFLKTVPMGEVTTYGAIARRFKIPNARNVGWILSRNTDPDKIPCYKVIRSDGRLAGKYKFGGPMEQKRRLVADGVAFARNGRIILENIFE